MSNTFARVYVILLIVVITIVLVTYFTHRPAPPPPLSKASPPVTSPLGKRVGPDYLYPNTALTPGKYATLNAGDLIARYSDHCPSEKTSCTYSQDHRHVPSREHQQVYDEYGVPPAARNIRSGEVDHLFPLCAGGSNDLANLWYEPATSTWNGQNFGFHQKDDLETWVCEQIKAGKLDPASAYQQITTDWVKFYLAVRPPQQDVRN